MTTKTTKKVKKKVTKTISGDRVTITKKQLEGVANFYAKQGKKVPAFITKKLA